MFKNLFDNLDKDLSKEPYRDGWEHISDELRLLDIRIHILLLIQRPRQENSPYEQFKGLILPEEEVYRLLDGYRTPDHDQQEIKALLEKMASLESGIRNRRLAATHGDVFLPLSYLTQIFNLTDFEEKCVIICLAVEMDRKYEKLYAFLQDDITCRSPSVDLVMKLLCGTPEERLSARLSFSPKGKLNRFFLKRDEPSSHGGTLLARPLKLDERIMNFLLNTGQVDDSVRDYARLIYPGEEFNPLLLGQEIQEKIRRFVESYFNAGDNDGSGIVFYLSGPTGAGKKLQVKHFCGHFGQALMIIDMAKLKGSAQPFRHLMQIIGREAILQQVALCFDNFNIMLEQDDATRGNLTDLLEIIKMFSGIVFLLSDRPRRAAGFTREHLIIDIELEIPQDFQRKQIWEHYAANFPFESGIDWGALAGKFRFTPGQIKDALTTAMNMSNWHYEKNALIKIEELYKACYLQAQHKLEERATRIQPRYTWPDIILPQEQKEQLRNACNQIKFRHIVYGQWGFEEKLSYGKGLSMLFSGPPGTGKTMSAQVVARELYMELYKIELSQVVSKYIGETEKNLQLIFHEARLSNAILFFDETDALFGKRSEVKDSHDRYANIETAFLLQKMEEYDGITIMATNFKQNIDDAFMRRISFVIEFPFPNTEYRKKIWQAMFPPEVPVSSDMDFDFLSEKLEIAGGNIKNIVLSSAFLAAENFEPIGMHHIIRAARYEMQKTGKILLREDLGEYGNLLDLPWA